MNWNRTHTEIVHGAQWYLRFATHKKNQRKKEADVQALTPGILKSHIFHNAHAVDLLMVQYHGSNLGSLTQRQFCVFALTFFSLLLSHFRQPFYLSSVCFFSSFDDKKKSNVSTLCNKTIVIFSERYMWSRIEHWVYQAIFGVFGSVGVSKPKWRGILWCDWC